MIHDAKPPPVLAVWSEFLQSPAATAFTTPLSHTLNKLCSSLKRAAWNVKPFPICNSFVDTVFCLLRACAFITHSAEQNIACSHFSCFPDTGGGESSLRGIALFFLRTEAIKKINMGWNMSDVSPNNILQPPKRHLSQTVTYYHSISPTGRINQRQFVSQQCASLEYWLQTYTVRTAAAVCVIKYFVLKQTRHRADTFLTNS